MPRRFRLTAPVVPELEIHAACADALDKLLLPPLKRIGGRLSQTRIGRTRKGGPRILVGQEEMFPRLIASGGFAAIAIVHSVEEMLAQLSTWGIPPRARGYDALPQQPEMQTHYA
jgi:hypothetical protein